MKNEGDGIYDIPIDLRLSGYDGEQYENGYIYCPFIPNSFTTKEERIEFNKKYNKSLEKTQNTLNRRNNMNNAAYNQEKPTAPNRWVCG